MPAKNTPDYAALLEARLASKARRTQKAPICLKRDLWAKVTEARDAYEKAATQPRQYVAKMTSAPPVDEAREAMHAAEQEYLDNSIMLVFAARTPAEDRAYSEACIVHNPDDKGGTYIDSAMLARMTVTQSVTHAEDMDGNQLDIPVEQLQQLIANADVGEFETMQRACSKAASADFPSSQR